MIAKLVLFVLLSLTTVTAWAQEASIKSFEIFKRIPILESGRLKPLDTYARNLLIQFSAQDTFNRKPAIDWLARFLFTPDAVKDDKVFLINNPDIPIALGITPDPHRRYTYHQLHANYKKFLSLFQSARKIPEKERGVVESEILRVFENLSTFETLSHEMEFAFTHDDFKVESEQTAKDLGLPAPGKFSFLDVALTADQMGVLTKDLDKKDSSGWSDSQRDAMSLLNNLFHWSMNYKDFVLNVIPSSKKDDLWISPWDAISADFQQEHTRLMVKSWQDMSRAYHDAQQIDFDLAAKTFLTHIDEHAAPKQKSLLSKFDIELLYHATRPFLLAKILYVLVLLFFVCSFLTRNTLVYQLAWISVGVGFCIHTLALVARIIIMARPPVTNLFETFIFVSFIGVLLGIAIEWVNKKWLGFVVASISGLALLFVASKYSAEGDTMKMLVAVLNSNFWLGTHVLTITMGYGATCVAGVVGHLWLIQRIVQPKDTQTLENTHKILIGMLGLSLTLTFLGTNLGGIWADQSWGRFWGWDPKENGALMIVLWVAMLFHAKISGMVKQVGMAVGAVLGMLVVMWAWFGVNLLSVGLHSYGFTSGIATGLTIYVVSELLFIAIALFLVRK